MYCFLPSLRAQNALAFKDALRTIDVLVIDDLQFPHGKSTQVEFCDTLNALIEAGRHAGVAVPPPVTVVLTGGPRVAIAAARPPSDLESLDERVRSRLAVVLVV